MSLKSRQYLILSATIFLCAVVLVWFFIVNVGKIIIHADPQYEVLLERYRRFECHTNPCVIRAKSGDYKTIFSKSGYYDIEMPITVSRFGEKEISFQFVLIPYIEEIPLSKIPKPPASMPIPPALGKFIPAVAVSDDQSYYYDPETKNIMQWSINGTKKTVPFASENKNIMLTLSPSLKWLTVADKNTIFTVDLTLQRKNKIDIAKKENYAIQWNPENDTFMYEPLSHDIVVYDPQNFKKESFAFSDPLLFVTWYNADQIFFITDKDIGFIDWPGKERKIILTNVPIIIQQESIVFDSDKKNLYFSSTEGIAYKMRLVE